MKYGKHSWGLEEVSTARETFFYEYNGGGVHYLHKAELKVEFFLISIHFCLMIPPPPPPPSSVMYLDIILTFQQTYFVSFYIFVISWHLSQYVSDGRTVTKERPRIWKRHKKSVSVSFEHVQFELWQFFSQIFNICVSFQKAELQLSLSCETTSLIIDDFPPIISKNQSTWITYTHNAVAKVF